MPGLGGRSIRNRGVAFRRSLFVALLLAATGSAAAAQTVRTLDPGTRVRVRLAQATTSIIAEIVGTRPDTIILGRTSTSIPSTIPLSVRHIRRLEISEGRKQLAPYGVLIGFVLGSAIVGSYNSIVQSQCFSDCPAEFPFLIGGLIGGAAGGLGFALIRAERWVEVPLPRMPAGSHPN